MRKPTDSLKHTRPVEQVLADCLRGLAVELDQLGFAKHGWAIRLVAADFLRLATLERECGGALSPHQALDLLLAPLDGGLAPGKRSEPRRR